jgi:hypothetical protein
MDKIHILTLPPKVANNFWVTCSDHEPTIFLDSKAKQQACILTSLLHIHINLAGLVVSEL